MEQDVIARVAGLVRELRQQRGESQADLADALGEKRETVKFWEAGKRYFKAGDIIAIANHFDVSADYLLGRSEAPTSDKDLQAVCDYTGLSPDTIKRLREIPSFVGGKESFPLLDEALLLFSADLCFRLSRIEKASADVQPVLDRADSVTRENWSVIFDDLSAAKKELELSLFSFSELSREMAEEMFSAYSNLREFDNAFDDVVKMGSDKDRYGGDE